MIEGWSKCDAENVFTFKFAIGVGIPFSLEYSSIFSVNNQNEDIVCCRLIQAYVSLFCFSKWSCNDYS